jgi:hypothetical protein
MTTNREIRRGVRRYAVVLGKAILRMLAAVIRARAYRRTLLQKPDLVGVLA